MKCKARNATGKPCKMPAVKGGQYCFSHDPANAAPRAEARKRGGFNSATPHAGNLEAVAKKPRSVEDALTVLDYTLAEALAADNGIQRTRALIALADSYKGLIGAGNNEDLIKALEIQIQELRAQVGSLSKARKADTSKSDLLEISVPKTEGENE